MDETLLIAAITPADQRTTGLRDGLAIAAAASRLGQATIYISDTDSEQTELQETSVSTALVERAVWANPEEDADLVDIGGHSQLVHLVFDADDDQAANAIRFFGARVGTRVAISLPAIATTTPSAWITQLQPLVAFADVVCFDQDDVLPLLEQGESILSLCQQLCDGGPNEVLVRHGDGLFVYHQETNDGIDVQGWAPKQRLNLELAWPSAIGVYHASRLRGDSVELSAQRAAIALTLTAEQSGFLRQSLPEIDKALEERE